MKTKTQKLVEAVKASGEFREVEIIRSNRVRAERGEVLYTIKLNKEGKLEVIDSKRM